MVVVTLVMLAMTCGSGRNDVMRKGDCHVASLLAKTFSTSSGGAKRREDLLRFARRCRIVVVEHSKNDFFEICDMKNRCLGYLR